VINNLTRCVKLTEHIGKRRPYGNCRRFCHCRVGFCIAYLGCVFDCLCISKVAELRKKVPVFLRQTNYKGFTLEDAAHRPNSLNVLRFPSRIAQTLFYPDGRIERVKKSETVVTNT